MSAGLYGNVNGVTRKIKKLYANVNGVNREIKELYANVGGVNRCVFQRGIPVTFYKSYLRFGDDKEDIAFGNSSNADYLNLQFQYSGDFINGDIHTVFRFPAITKPPKTYVQQFSNFIHINGKGYFSIGGSGGKDAHGAEVCALLTAIDLDGKEVSRGAGKGSRIAFKGNRYQSEIDNIDYVLANCFFEADIQMYQLDINMAIYANTKYDKTFNWSYSIPWSAFTWIPTGDKFIY